MDKDLVNNVLTKYNGRAIGKDPVSNATVWAIIQDYNKHQKSIYNRKINVFIENTGKLIPENLVDLNVLISKLSLYNIKLIDFRARSRAAPEKEMIFEADKLFKNISYPALIHCKSGADRAGIMCALYFLLQKKQETKKAKQQLSWKYLHIKWAKPGVLDSFVHEYSTQYKIDKIKFLDWVKKKYDPSKLEKNFRSIWWVNRLVDDVLKRE